MAIAVIRRIRYFRMIDGKLIPHTLELDANMVLINEFADVTALDHVANSRSDRHAERSPEQVELQTLARWASASVTVNPIPGTEEMRERFLDDLTRLKASYAGQCPNCELSKLIGRYQTELKNGNWL